MGSEEMGGGEYACTHMRRKASHKSVLPCPDFSELARTTYFQMQIQQKCPPFVFWAEEDWDGSVVTEGWVGGANKAATVTAPDWRLRTAASGTAVTR